MSGKHGISKTAKRPFRAPALAEEVAVAVHYQTGSSDTAIAYDRTRPGILTTDDASCNERAILSSIAATAHRRRGSSIRHQRGIRRPPTRFSAHLHLLIDDPANSSRSLRTISLKMSHLLKPATREVANPVRSRGGPGMVGSGPLIKRRAFSAGQVPSRRRSSPKFPARSKSFSGLLV